MPHFGSHDFERMLEFEFETDLSSKTDFCCDRMQQSVTYECGHDHDKWDCGDILLHYNPVFDEYGLIIHDGGASFVQIDFCPWCGSKLPESKRDRWFDELEAKGIDDPLEEEIPKEYGSAEWYQAKK